MSRVQEWVVKGYGFKTLKLSKTVISSIVASYGKNGNGFENWQTNE